MEIELVRLRQQNTDFTHKLSEYTLHTEKFKNEARLKENIIEKLETEVNDLNVIIDTKKEENREKI